MEEVEIGKRVVCAANLMKDKQGNSYLIVGARHWDTVMVAQFEKLRELGIDWEKKGVQQGFIDQRGNCDNCNAQHDRDENACLNLYNYNNNAAGTAVNACGGNVRPKTSKKIISKKSRAVSCETRIHVL